MVLANQGLLGIAFFEANASIILLVLFLLFRRDHQASYFPFSGLPAGAALLSLPCAKWRC